MSVERTERSAAAEAATTPPAADGTSNLPARTDAPAETANVPATRPDMPLTVADADRRPVAWRQPVSVAYLPLALVTLLVLAFAMAMWTFLTATT